MKRALVRWAIARLSAYLYRRAQEAERRPGSHVCAHLLSDTAVDLKHAERMLSDHDLW